MEKVLCEAPSANGAKVNRDAGECYALFNMTGWREEIDENDETMKDICHFSSSEVLKIDSDFDDENNVLKLFYAMSLRSITGINLTNIDFRDNH